MSDEQPVIQYINTDLDLCASRALAPLAIALEALGLFALNTEQFDDGLWHSRLEVANDPETDEPESTIRMMLDAIEALEGVAKDLWEECSQREFNIGYDCGDEPWAFNNGLTNATLKRMVGVGASLRITLYPFRPSRPAT